MKKSILILFIPLLIISINGCNKKTNNPVLSNYSIHRDDEFGGAYIDISIEGFNKLGFSFGDSLDLSFSNNVKYEDIGYYSGYYVPAGQELVVGYPGYDYIKFCINYGDDVYTMNNFNKDTKVTITVNQKAKYKDIEETLSINYSDDPTAYESLEEFANFREIKAGNLKEGKLFRGASPIDNRRKRAPIVDGLLEQNGIDFDIDLSDTRITVDDFYKKSDFGSPYFKSLDEAGNVITLGMAAAYKTEEFSSKMRAMFNFILENDGSFYIHCLEGKDRTGYVCMVLEALCGATYDEIVDDYFTTYHNYYGIEKGTKKYDLIKEIHIDEMIRYVFDFNESVNLLGANYRSSANGYLLSIGLSQDNIDSIQSKLSKE